MKNLKFAYAKGWECSLCMDEERQEGGEERVYFLGGSRLVLINSNHFKIYLKKFIY